VQSKYFIGLDLGQRNDFTALAIIERQGEVKNAVFVVNHLQRFPLGTSYPAIVGAVGEILKRAPLASNKTSLSVDETGVGTPVVELFKQARYATRLTAIHITGGTNVRTDNGITYVPKRELVGVVQVGLQTGSLKIAPALTEAATLARELQDFRVTITEAANDTYGGRSGTHDDLVLAVAMALWTARRHKDVEISMRSYSFSAYGRNL
jgi:hypothetical protein